MLKKWSSTAVSLYDMAAATDSSGAFRPGQMFPALSTASA
jgi:hypothetical protein